MSDPEDPAVQGADKAFHPPEDEDYVGPSVRGDEGDDGERQEGWPGPGVTDDDPDQVGQSNRRSGEDIAASEDEEGRTTEGTKGPAGRPYGTSDAESATGVDPQEQVTGGPEMPPGDQGG